MESIGGYRIIRRLGSGARSDVYLGHAGRAPGGAPQLAAIKVFYSHVPEESIDAEIAALSRVDHAHVTRLLDLATGPRNIPCLVLQRLEPGGLPRLLADRLELEPGEAVTILAPILAAVAAIHSTGIVHGGLGAQSVLFDAAGAPVISGFGGARSIVGNGERSVTAALLDSDPGVADDRAALAALAVAVLNRVSGASSSVDELIGWLGDQLGHGDAHTALESRLFALATPLPVRFAAQTPERSVPLRLAPAGRSGVEHRSLDPEEPDLAGTGWSSRIALLGHSVLPPEIATWLGRQWAAAPHWLEFRVAALSTAIRSVRRRAWVVAGIGVVSMAIAVAIAQLPAEDPGTDTVAAGTPTPTPSAPPEPSAPAAASDDPIVATGALLERRLQCLRDRSILCLDAVHAPESAAWKADAALIQSVDDGGEIGADQFDSNGSVTLVDRMGDTALLAIGHADADAPDNATTSVLMIRTEVGWRFRSLIIGSPPVG